MNPFLTMYEVLVLLVDGQEATALIQPDAADDQGTEPVQLSSLYSDGPQWMTEARMVVDQIPLIGARDPLIRSVLMPMIHAHRLLADEAEGDRRFEAAREALGGCAAEDWKNICTAWIDYLQEGGE